MNALGLLLASMLVPLAVHATVFDSTAAFAQGQRLRAAVSAGDAAVLWPAFNAEMRTAMKDSASFATMVGSIADRSGAVDSVLSENVSESVDNWVYVARCRFAKSPAPLEVRIVFDPDGLVAGLLVRPADRPKAAPSAYLDYSTKTALRLPFDGEWFVVWGGRTIEQNYHAVNATQRFAMDLLVREGGASHRGDGRELVDYFCYGRPVLAPGAGSVVAAVDTFPDQPIGGSDTAHPAGNFVLIDHGNGEYSLLAHMQPRSLTVRVGARVRAGQALGKVGNSGNTSEPHIHYHLQNSRVPLEGEGLPAWFERATVDGKRVERTEIVRGQVVAPAK